MAARLVARVVARRPLGPGRLLLTLEPLQVGRACCSVCMMPCLRGSPAFLQLNYQGSCEPALKPNFAQGLQDALTRACSCYCPWQPHQEVCHAAHVQEAAVAGPGVVFANIYAVCLQERGSAGGQWRDPLSGAPCEVHAVAGEELARRLGAAPARALLTEARPQ